MLVHPSPQYLSGFPFSAAPSEVPCGGSLSPALEAAATAPEAWRQDRTAAPASAPEAREASAAQPRRQRRRRGAGRGSQTEPKVVNGREEEPPKELRGEQCGQRDQRDRQQIRGHVVQLSKTEAGRKFLQRKLLKGNIGVAAIIVEE